VTAEQRFWQWFMDHEPKLFELQVESPEDRERVLDELAIQIQKIDPHLTL
jgi:hypothetical protein